MSIADNVRRLREIIQRHADHPVTLIAVTKGRTVGEIHEVIAAGVTDIGENRLQEAEQKISSMVSARADFLVTNSAEESHSISENRSRDRAVKWHFIGHLQTNKVADVVRFFDMIQSVDSLRLAKKINDECVKIGKIMPVLIEVNTSGEAQKSGVVPKDCEALVREVAILKNVSVQGLMTVAVASDDEAKVRTCFRTLKKLFDQCNAAHLTTTPLTVLSMGMSDDYEIALKEGATMVRIGRVLFG